MFVAVVEIRVLALTACGLTAPTASKRLRNTSCRALLKAYEEHPRQILSAEEGDYIASRLTSSEMLSNGSDLSRYDRP